MKLASILSVLVLMIASTAASANYGRNYCSIRKPTAYQRMMCNSQRREGGGNRDGRGGGNRGGGNCGKGGNRGGGRN